MQTPAPTIDLSDIRFGADLKELTFADVAQDKARVVAETGAGERNKSTQLRKFYDELVMWHEKVNLARSDAERTERYREAAPFIKMMIAKVTYARGRKHVDDCFEKLFTHVVRQIRCPTTLKHAKLFMEAFMGFYKAEEKTKEK
ncbi:type III-A CRISPR-associated protein Csm2 [Accumulibacter sp.]|uniref:type III-A CRISPR-associated protein Csm2 n=1 Tax=Accumulibacter sp. TaxID=2053492 RepID=UPI0025FFDCDF|nr:type III-A CRISPR-associated protein Csm2 [Accumulibacter sp.]MCM8626801.1 type III-A CRISPR-associated protein Csm2 [Accumulibacter sp.]